MSVDLRHVPEQHRDIVTDVVADAFGTGDVDSIETGPTGASGARTYRVRAAAGDHLIRIEGGLTPGRNPHQHVNLLAAAEAGIAPPVRLVDEVRGVTVVAWVDQRPLDGFPGGPGALVEAVGHLVAQLHALAPFPAHDDWAEVIARMLGHAQLIGQIAPEVAVPILETYRRIGEAWPRDHSRFVPAHNDPNATNILFDGDRLWLIDWETSSPNDPLVDLAVVANQLAPTADLRDCLLRAWSGHEPDDVLRARLSLAQLAAQLFAGSAIALVTSSLGLAPIEDLDAPSPEEFQRLVMSGRLPVGHPETMRTFAQVVLAQFVLQTSSAEFESALAVSVAG